MSAYRRHNRYPWSNTHMYFTICLQGIVLHTQNRPIDRPNSHANNSAIGNFYDGIIHSITGVAINMTDDLVALQRNIVAVKYKKLPK